VPFWDPNPEQQNKQEAEHYSENLKTRACHLANPLGRHLDGRLCGQGTNGCPQLCKQGNLNPHQANQDTDINNSDLVIASNAMSHLPMIRVYGHC
jgi:hypothetical protein